MNTVPFLRMRGLMAAAFLLTAASAWAARMAFNMNQGWDFFRPEAPVSFQPDKADLTASGEFPRGTSPQIVTFAERQARFVCLQALSSHGNPFASNPIKAEAGIATILIKSTTSPGRITIKAAAYGVTSAETVIESKPLNEAIL